MVEARTGLSEPKDLSEAKKVAAEVRAGRAPKEALLPHWRGLAPAERAELEAFLERLSPPLLRYLRRAPKEEGVAYTPHTPQGKTHTLYLRPLPGEVQMRAAYEIAQEGFLAFLEARGYPVVGRGEGWVEVYQSPALPEPPLEEFWRAYLDEALGLEGLSRGLLVLLNSVTLAPRGISAPKVPVPTLGVRDFLASWYLASLLEVKERLAWRRREMARLEETLAGASERERKGLERRLKELQKKQAEEEEKYRKAIADKWAEVRREWLKTRKGKRSKSGLPFWALRTLALGARGHEKLWDRLDPTSPKAPKPIRRLGAYLGFFGPTARRQLSTAVGNKFSKILEEFLRLLALQTPEVHISPLVGSEPFLWAPRPPGDKAKVCYACGNPLKGSEEFKASKFIFAAPSQRLQGGYAQEEPPVCSACAGLALLSPLKPGSGSVLVRIGRYEAPEAAHYFARLLAAGTLHLAAGRYLLLRAQAVGGKPLSESFGRVVYALQVLGKEVNPKVLRRFPIFLMEGGQEIPLPRRALWLAHVLQEAFPAQPVEGSEANRDLAESLRYALADLPWHAGYTLARRYGWAKAWTWARGLAEYSLILEEEMGMEEAKRFRDTAGLIGLLEAWAQLVEREAGVRSQRAKRALRKLLENLEEPSRFLYVASYEVNQTEARLDDSDQGSFFYQEAKRLLGEAGRPIREEEEGGGRYLRVGQDDLYAVYTHLAQGLEGKEWEKFLYGVRLGLAARFPQYIRQD